MSSTLAELLEPVVVVFQITTPYGRQLDIPMRLLTWHEWNETGLMVKDPAIPKHPQTGELNPADMKYQKDMRQAQDERAYLRLAMAMIGGGYELSGETLSDQADSLRDMPYDIAVALINQLGMIAQQTKARAVASADMFRTERIRANGDADPTEARVEPVGVGGAGGGG